MLNTRFSMKGIIYFSFNYSLTKESRINVLSQLLTLGIVHSREEAQNLIRQSELLKSYAVEDLDNVETSQQFFKSLVEKGE